MDLMPFLKAKGKKGKVCKDCKKPMSKCKCDDEGASDQKGSKDEKE